jgi:subtilisin-like proprotein convertase family protein
MSHSWISDMVINLQAPNGKVLNLFNRHGGRGGTNLVNTVVSSTSTSKFSNGSAPFTGTFSATAEVNVGPIGYKSNAANFTALYSTTPYLGNNNYWVLAIRDSEIRDIGILTSWAIAFKYSSHP